MDVDFSVASSGPASVTSTMLGGSGGEFQSLLSTPPMVTGHAGVAATTLLSPHAPSPPPLSNLFGLIIPGFPVRTDFVPADATGTKFTMQWQVPMGSTNSALSHGGGGDNNHHRKQQEQPISSINEVVAFLLPNVPLPPNHGVLFFWQISVVGGLSSSSPSHQQTLIGSGTTTTRTTGFALLGALTPHHQPSNVFRTGWSEHEDVLEMERSVVMALSSSQQQQLPQQQPQLVVTFGVSLESMDNIQNLPTSGTNHNNERRLFVAQQIATDLFQFMQSFDTSSSITPGSSTHASSMMVVPTNIFDRWMKRFEARFRRDPNFFLKPSQS